MMNDEALSETVPLIDLGVDSLVAVEVRKWFAQEVGADVAVLKILGGPSIQELVDDVISKVGSSLQADVGTKEAGSGSGSGSSTQSTGSEGGSSSPGWSPGGERASQTSEDVKEKE
jgi:hybrid polyketide synthase / nonribosomal peptide synthetase ACE1